MPFRIALSGLNAASADLKATGNNIANAGTVGFKSSRTEFVDVFAVSYGGISSTAIGGGARLASVTQQFSQGNIDFTDNNLDLAINGQGFFVVEDNGARLLSRAGAFAVDRDGYVTNSSGYRLQMFDLSRDAGGNPITGADGNLRYETADTVDVQLATTIGAPNATSLIDPTINLNSGDNVIDRGVTAFNVNDASTYTSSTSLTVYDSQGGAYPATQYFTNVSNTGVNGDNTWEVRLYVNGAPLTSTTTGGPAATLIFDNVGQVDATSTDAGQIAYDPFAVSGAANLNITLDLTNTTQYGSPFAVTAMTQDGYSSGRLSGIDIDQEGVISARYTNGQSEVLGKVALANVANPQALSPQGDTVWAETFAAGDLLLGEAGSSTYGLLQSGALEGSNVDIAAQLVSLITAQRNFQANAQVISTADTVTQTIINIR